MLNKTHIIINSNINTIRLPYNLLSYFTTTLPSLSLPFSYFTPTLPLPNSLPYPYLILTLLRLLLSYPSSFHLIRSPTLAFTSLPLPYLHLTHQPYPLHYSQSLLLPHLYFTATLPLPSSLPTPISPFPFL